MLSYFEFNGKFVARNPKVGTFSNAQAIHDTLGLDIKDAVLKFAIPQTPKPTGMVYLLVRDPVERFLSACRSLRISVDEALSGHMHEEHFCKQSDFVIPGKTKIYKFPEQYSQFCQDVGIPEYHLNISPDGSKQEATDAERQAIEYLYPEDYALLESI